MKLCQFLVAAMLLMSSAIVLAEKPDPNLPNPPLAVREANVDTSDWIRVHEQGIADVNVIGGQIDANITNSSLEVTGSVGVNNFPPVQDVNIVGGQVEVLFAPVTAVESGEVNSPAGAIKDVSFPSALMATAVSISFAGSTEAFVWFTTPFGRILFVHNSWGVEQTHMFSFTHPVEIDGLHMKCLNSSDSCRIAYSVMGL